MGRQIRTGHLYEGGQLKVGDYAYRLCDSKLHTIQQPTKLGHDFIMCGGCWAKAQGQPITLYRPVQQNRSE